MKKFFTFVAAAFVALTMNAQAISVADAITACMALDSAATSEADYTIEGYVVNAQDFNIAYNNINCFGCTAILTISDIIRYSCTNSININI